MKLHFRLQVHLVRPVHCSHSLSSISVSHRCLMSSYAAAMDDIDNLLREADAAISFAPTQSPAISSRNQTHERSAAAVPALPANSTKSVAAAPKKCAFVTLTADGDVCRRLQCAQCDHDVIIIPRRRWTSAVPYMTLRTHIPNVDALKAYLRTDDAACAYACQCKHAAVDDTSARVSSSSLKWICRGH